MISITPIPATRSRAARRGGFTFTEILFAVMIMGIGFIMVAAMFPATIRQTMTTMEETQGAVVARAGFAAMQEIAIDYIDPANGNTVVEEVLPPTASGAGAIPRMEMIKAKPKAWAMASGQAIMTQNPRYAWVAMYSRDYGADNRPSDYVRVVIVAVEARLRSQYYILPPGTETSDILTRFSNGMITLQPRLLTGVNVRYDKALKRSLLTYSGVGYNTPSDPVAPGAYVVIASDATGSGSTGGVVGKSIGRIYQVGNYYTVSGAWELAPGGDMIPDTAMDPAYGSPRGIADNEITNGEAMVVGRTFTKATNGYVGPAQDIAAYTGFVRVRKVDVKYRPTVTILQ